MIKPLKIGKVLLKNNLVLAPMSGITDMTFRLIAKKGGAGLVCTEMISSNALVHKDNKTKKMLRISKDEHPVSVQIFGSKPEAMKEAAKIVEDSGADIVDINLGCPANKIVKSGAGVRLMDNEKTTADIIENVVKSVKIPVTIKIRIGRSEGENLAPHIIKMAEKLEVKAVTIHGRAAKLQHSGKPDLSAVKQACESANLPIIGNGGIINEKTASEFLESTGCDGLMIGRAAIEDPGIFERIEYFLNTGKTKPEPSWEKRINYLKNHAETASEYYGEKVALLRLRKIAPYYLKGLPNATKIRASFNKIVSLKELDELLSMVWKSPYFEDV
ncbi:MAG: tRNA dihydrouridine synthase DusB [Endomicrobiales bacterium]|nr:tRNA dihydrouridine synthase DusB [Endomicrobiales bacterium]